MTRPPEADEVFGDFPRMPPAPSDTSEIVLWEQSRWQRFKAWAVRWLVGDDQP